MACDVPHSPHQCAIAQALEESMKREGEPDINMFDTMVESDNESSQSESNACDEVSYNKCCQGQLQIDWHPTLNMVTIEDEDVHLRRPNDEEVRNLTKAAIAKAKHNYNLRSNKKRGRSG